MSSAHPSVIIKGTGSYAPAQTMTNHDLAKRVDTSDEWILTRTGIKERRIAGDNETASDMAVEAARRAIRDANIDAQDIDLIVVATMTPDMPFPSTACLVQSKLGIDAAACLDAQAACSGFLYILELASSMLLTGRYRNALIIGSEKLSSILDWTDRSTCVLFGDGAGAAVLSTSEEPGIGVIDFKLGADGNKGDLLFMPGGGCAYPPSRKSLEKGAHFLKMRGKEVYKHAVRVMGQSATDILAQNHLTSEDIDCVVPHQANYRIIEAISERLALPMERFFLNMDKYGNTSAASIPIALDEARRAGKIQPDSATLMIAFGAGLTWGAALVRWGR